MRTWVRDKRCRVARDTSKLCRMRGCRAPAVWEMRRANGWWAYCGEHLYGRRIRNGHLEFPVAVGSPAQRRGWV